MRKFFVTAFVLAAMTVFATSALALEKTSVRAIDTETNWDAASTVTLQYFNICTGWVWIWSGWSNGNVAGVNYGGHGGGLLNTTGQATWSGVPSGYGFTGTISVQAGAGCGGAVLSSQPHLPPVGTTVYYSQAWGGLAVPDPFAVNVTWAVPTTVTSSGIAWASDHPAAGPTGPASCGTCFPTSRVANSFTYAAGCGSASSLADGVCDAEFFGFAALKTTISVEDASWGSVKNLYK